GYGYVNQAWTRRSWDAASAWDWKEEYRDALGRKYRTRRRGLQARAIVTDSQFQWMDLVKKSTHPYYEGDAPLWVSSIFDVKRRPVEIDYPNQLSSIVAYDDVLRKVTKTEPNGKSSLFVMNPRNKMAQKVDATSYSTWFYYDGLGRLTATVDAEMNTTQT